MITHDEYIRIITERWYATGFLENLSPERAAILALILEHFMQDFERNELAEFDCEITDDVFEVFPYIITKLFKEHNYTDYRNMWVQACKYYTQMPLDQIINVCDTYTEPFFVENVEKIELAILS
jgi:hypothetical protein